MRRPTASIRLKALQSKASFTLIELLVVIGIVAILSVAVLLALNPTQLMAQGRDATRLNDLDALQHALTLYGAEQSNFGSSTVIYISLPDTSLSGSSTSTCTSLNLPTPPAGYNYQCVSAQNLQNTDGTGWIPVNFTTMTSKPLSQLPIDPVNTTSSGNYYVYTTNGSQFELTSLAESQKYRTQTNSKTNFQPGLLAQGTSLSLNPIFNSNGLVGYWNFDEGSGTIVYDKSGNGNNGTMYSSSTAVDLHTSSNCKLNSCAYFNGTTNIIRGGGNLPKVSGPWTLMAWVYPINLQSGSSIMTSHSGCGSFGLTINSFGYLADDMPCRTGGNFGPHLTTNVWNFISIRWDGASRYLTAGVNGGPLSTVVVTDANIPINSDGSFTIGARGDAVAPWSGVVMNLDEARIYNRSLSNSEIQAIYNATK